MSLPPPPGEHTSETGTLKRKTPSLDRTPTQGMSPDQTPTHSRLNTPCFSPTLGSECSTPVQECCSPVNFSPSQSFANGIQSHDKVLYVQQPPAYVHPPQYRASSTLPAFNNNNGLRSSLRQTSLPRQVSVNSIASSNSSNSSGGSIAPYIAELQAKNAVISPHVQRKVNFQEPASPKKPTKKITFNLTPQEVPPLPKKPPPPKRSENTKLSSPKKLAEPPKDFLKDLQRVMRKKWQVAQKCKLEPATTPHEVLGFRDPPALLPDYKETNVSNWVQEHYGPNNFYENLYSADNVVEYASSPMHGKSEAVKCKRPPPPPPKRSETTHLSTTKMH